jgi:hypothetical protein
LLDPIEPQRVDRAAPLEREQGPAERFSRVRACPRERRAEWGVELGVRQ